MGDSADKLRVKDNGAALYTVFAFDPFKPRDELAHRYLSLDHPVEGAAIKHFLSPFGAMPGDMDQPFPPRQTRRLEAQQLINMINTNT